MLFFLLFFSVLPTLVNQSLASMLQRFLNQLGSGYVWQKMWIARVTLVSCEFISLLK